MFEPGSPMWQPRTEADIEAARSTGLLGEGHHLDIKREIPSGAAANKETAKDLASFAIDGGAIVVGIDEKANPPSLHAVTLKGLPERIEQIGLLGVQEPLAVRTIAVPSDADPDEGFVVVIIPPSGRGPQMVDGRYYGRNDKTKYVLSDAEVTRLHEARLGRERNALDELTREMTQSPVPNNSGIVMVRARPVSGRPDLALALTGASDWEKQHLDLILAATQATSVVGRGGDHGYSPDLTYASNSSRRPGGIARTHNLGAGRTLTSTDVKDIKRTVEVYLGEDGSVSAMCGRATEVLGNHPEKPSVVFELLILGYAHRVLAMASIIATRYGYYGAWDFAIGVDGLHGHVSWEIAAAHFFTRDHAYTENDYERACRASYEEITQTPNAVVGALTGALMRSLGSAEIAVIKALID